MLNFLEKISPEKPNSLFQETARLIDPKIKEVLINSVDKETQKLVNYQIEVGGKRLRPALAVLTCLLCGGKLEDVLYPAAGLEILHNCTLIYDDIIDNSTLRRDRPTTWAKFGRSIAQCIGMDYAAAIFQAANLSKEPIKVSELFAKTMKAVVDGEILDILFEQFGRQDENYINGHRYKSVPQRDYRKMISKKTAALIQACCEAGGIAANSEEKEMLALRNFGFNLGIAFQIRDDILDIFGHEKEFGKRIGTDIKERKLGNIVIFYALKELPLLKKQKILATLRKRNITRNNIRETISLIRETKAKEKADILGQKYIERAKESLKSLPQNKWNQILSRLSDFVMTRNK